METFVALVALALSAVSLAAMLRVRRRLASLRDASEAAIRVAEEACFRARALEGRLADREGQLARISDDFAALRSVVENPTPPLAGLRGRQDLNDLREQLRAARQEVPSADEDSEALGEI